MFSKQTNRTETGMLTAIAATAIVSAAAPTARGGWTVWQNPDRAMPNPVAAEVPVRLSAATLFSGVPLIVTASSNGKVMAREEGPGFWRIWSSTGGIAMFISGGVYHQRNPPQTPFTSDIPMTVNAKPQPMLFHR